MTKAKADELGIKTYSDLAAKSGELKLGGPPEFPERQDTMGLLAAYGFDPKVTGHHFVQLDTRSLRYDASQNRQNGRVRGFGTDGQSHRISMTPRDAHQRF